MLDNERSVVSTLSAKQRRFLEHYLKSWNATESARVAGYKHPHVQGPRLLNDNAQITNAITERLETAAMSANEVLTRLGQQARAEYASYLRANDDGRISLDAQAMIADGLGHLIKGVKETQYGQNIEFHDVQAALVHLGRHHGQFTDKTDLTTDGKPLPIAIIKMDADEL